MSLYSGEKISMWNPETDDQEFTEQLEQEQAESKQLQEEGRTLEALKGSEGWKLISTFLDDCIDAYKEKLVAEQDLDKIRRLQSTILAYSNVQLFVAWKIDAGRSFNNQQTPSDKGII